MNVNDEPNHRPESSSRTFADLRRDRGMTLEEVATKAGYTSATAVWRVERGAMPKLDQALRLAAALGTSLEELSEAIARAADDDADRRTRLRE